MASSKERVPVVIVEYDEIAKTIARRIAEIIKERRREGSHAVLGLATGSTPIGIYRELIKMHREEGLDFSDVVTFNLDEYYPMKPESIHSYHRFMRENLFNHINVKPENIHIPKGDVPRDDVEEECDKYEALIKRAGGIDLQILGIGKTGHIGFNEPGSGADSRTRRIALDTMTRRDAAGDFFGEDNVPTEAITMGVATIMEAKEIALVATGEHKAAIIKRAVEGDITSTIAASFLQQHKSARIVLDPAAAAELTRFKTPWLLGGGAIEQFGLAWDTQTTKRAVIWLSLTLGKPILKLTDEDYNEHGLQDMLAARGGAYDINIEVFRALQKTITGWPGGKSGPGFRPASPASTIGPKAAPGSTDADTGQRPVPQDEPFPKRVVVFSPHPDDDVISMGGTFIRLCDQGHEVHVAYQTSGNIAVWDESALRHVDFIREFAAAFPQLGREFAERLEANIEAFLSRKHAGEPDSPELQKVKGLIRRSEARAGARYSGVKLEHIHFLDLPFYETGRVRKKPIGEEDIRITMDLLEKVKPHQIYAAGDLSDPHGTHRVCLAAILESLKRLAGRDWMKPCVVWLYRGAWQEWGPEEIQMAVPLSPDEVKRKRYAIFKHESQKDSALFPGPNDPREFWQRAEDRNRNTARIYDKLGLAEYEAIEGFVRWNGQTI
jgi:glucosamine-6-phosphate deaminase